LPSRVHVQAIIDEALKVVYASHHRLVSSVFPGAQHPLNIKELRRGRLGRDLQAFAELAYGNRKEPKDQVNERVASVLQLLFWAPMAEDYQIPRSFWETELGRMISTAKYRAHEPSELVSVGQAAMRLRVTRPTVFRWMDEGHLNYVRDEQIGRTFVVLEDVEALLKWAESTGDDEGGQQDRGPPRSVHRKAVDADTSTASPATTTAIPSRPRCVDAYALYVSILPHAAGPSSQ
jgi:excisionase family DNA binding protein